MATSNDLIAPHHEEFYQVILEHWNVAQLESSASSLGAHLQHRAPSPGSPRLTPLEFLQRWQDPQKKAECHLIMIDEYRYLRNLLGGVTLPFNLGNWVPKNEEG